MTTERKQWVSWEELNYYLPDLSPFSVINYSRIGGLTPGSIPFADTAGLLDEDNANLFWDEANAFLGIHETTPTALVHINSVGGAIPALNLESGAEGELVTPDGQQLRIGHWNGVDTFTERMKIDAAGLVYISYLTSGSVIFAGANGEIKQDVANLYWDDGNNRLGVGKFPVNPLDVEGAGTTGGGTSYGGVVARFHNTTAAKHTSISIDALTGYDPVLYLAENDVAIWDIRNDATATDEFQIRYQVGEVNRTDFKIDNAGNVSILTGTLTLLNEALHLLDTGGDHDLIIKPGEDLAADTILTLVMGDAARTITLSGNPTLADWFDQAVKQASTPTFDDLTITTPVNIYALSHNSFADYIANEHINWEDTAGVADNFGTSGFVALHSNAELRFYDNGNYVGFEAPALGADQIWVLPVADGAAGEVLSTSGAGVLSWITTADVKVAVDNAAVADYLGAAFNDGCLRTDGTQITLADGGNFVTLTTAQAIDATASPTFVGLTLSGATYLYGDIYTDRWLNRDENTFIGIDVCGLGNLAHAAGSTGWHNVAIGYQCLRAITTGERNVAIGSQSLLANLAGQYNMAIGFAALIHNETGSWNVAIGGDALNANVSGNYNMAIGKGALFENVDTSYNVAIGGSALYNSDASSNVGIGYQAGNLNTTGWGNVFLGSESGRQNVGGARDVYIGQQAGRNALGYRNVAIGYRCYYGAGATTTGNDNVFIGDSAGYLATTASNNVIIGKFAAEDLTSGTGNVVIGYMAAEGSLTVGNNQLWIANSDTATPLIYGEFPNTLFRITATNINAIGITNLGDGGVTNYASFAVDGTLSLFGTAKVLKRVFLNNAAFTKGGTAPVQIILGFLNGWEFDIGDDAVMTSMVPDDWDTTTNLTIKVCWYIDEAYAADKEIQWRVDWSAIPHDFSETVDAPTHTGNISSGDIDIPAVAKRMGTSTIGVIVAADLAAGDMLGFKLSRIAVTHDNPGAKPTAHHLMIEYTADKLGT